MSDIFSAAAEGDLPRVEELLAQGGLDLAACYADVTALYFAASHGHLNVAKALIHAGAPLNVPDESLCPLHGAVDSSHHDLAAMLLREGAEVHAYDTIGGTPLSWAKDRRMAALLIAAGADVNGFLDTPLIWAAANGRLEVLKELLSHPNINVNKQDGQNDNRTPLHEAARHRHSECVTALLAAGADACITDANGHTPLRSCFARRENYSEVCIIAMLVAAGDRQWAYVPSPCFGLKSALLPVWKEAPEELPQLAVRLQPGVKRRIQAALCTLHHTSSHHLPEAIRMRLLDEAFNV